MAKHTDTTQTEVREALTGALESVQKLLESGVALDSQDMHLALRGLKTVTKSATMISENHAIGEGGFAGRESARLDSGDKGQLIG